MARPRIEGTNDKVTIHKNRGYKFILSAKFSSPKLCQSEKMIFDIRPCNFSFSLV